MYISSADKYNIALLLYRVSICANVLLICNEWKS
nr:MAG TPA: hypothetical protein [Caudoviricetes sp.]